MNSVVQPTILAFDCLGTVPSYALRHQGVLYEGSLKDALSQTLSCQLIPALQAVAEQANISLSQINVVATLTGPGSFTGIRLGLATLTGFKISTSCLYFTPTRLDLWAFSAWKSNPSPLMVALSSHRGDYFCQETTADFTFQTPPCILTAEDLSNTQASNPLLSLISDDATLNSLLPHPPRAKTLIEFYEFSLTYSKRPLSEEASPFYLRLPQFIAQQKKNE